MIPVGVTALAFCVVAIITQSRTYWVLAISAVLNIAIDQFTTDHDRWLMVTYSTIEFWTCLAVLSFGDIHKTRQAAILAFMLLLHITMEGALTLDVVWAVESGAYTYAMSALILGQLIGAGRGIDATYTVHRLGRYLRPIGIFGLPNNQKHSFSKEPEK